MSNFLRAQDHVPLELFPNPSKQESCPIFKLIPPELRCMIFEYALTPYTDSSRPLRYPHPLQKFPEPITMALLQTCKAIYNEARLIPMWQTEHRFWLYGRGHVVTTSRRPVMMIWPRYADKTCMKLVNRIRFIIDYSHVELRPICQVFKYTNPVNLTLDFTISPLIWWKFESTLR